MAANNPPLLRITVACLGMLSAFSSWASCADPVAKLISLEGSVQTRENDAQPWRLAALNDTFCPGDTLSVRPLGRAAIVLANDIVVRLDQGSVLKLHEIHVDKPFELGLVQGVLHVLTRLGKRFGVMTPFMNAMVDGTEFTVRVQDGSTRVSVTEGRVLAENTLGVQRLTAGMAAQSGAQQAPQPLSITPQDAVQWAIYFPQIVQPDPKVLQGLPAAAQSAAQLGMQGQYAQALSAWPASNFDDLRGARAGWLLGLGRVAEAQSLLADQTNTNALAVKALVELANNQIEAAQASAQAAVQSNVHSAAAYLSLGYVQQAQRNLDAALQSSQTAVNLQPEHALAWARLAELQLASGRLGQGQASAKKALLLNPQTPRALALLGFSQLLRNQFEAAKTSFIQAQAQYSADPLAQLGLGLCALRAGQPSQGRQALEIAVVLDPSNAQTRTLLARAYLQEQRLPLVATELALAKQFDPHSPDPWLVEGMVKQRQNRPVEAAEDFERALQLSDQRAVLRSSALLDVDSATRSAALAANWRELGFDGTALFAARGALATDPQNPAAHRLLAQSYATQARLENARVSELLQAQLRQSPHTEPLAPQELIPGLPIVQSTQALALFDPSALLEENRSGARLGVSAGNHHLWGSLANAWTSVGEGQISLGHFGYRTDGAKPGLGVRLHTENLLWQTPVVPDFNLQLELRRSRNRGGDVTQVLNPLSSAPESQRRIDTDTARVGWRYAPRPELEWLSSLVWRQRDFRAVDISRFDADEFTSLATTQRKAKLAETLLTYQRGSSLWTVGASLLRGTLDEQLAFNINGVPVPLTAFNPSSQSDRHDVLFAHTQWSFGRQLALHAGLSHDAFVSPAVSLHKTHPKLGLHWQPSSNLGVRVAAFSTTATSPMKEQTIAPTQFAGFNQIFDDLQGTTSKQLAAALDHRLSHTTRWGWETVARKMQIYAQPLNETQGCEAVCRYAASEYKHQLYLNHRISSRWAMSSALGVERHHISTPGATLSVPAILTTSQLSARANYFHPQGWSTYAQVRGVRQRADYQDPEAPNGQARFALLDIGWRYQTPRQHVALLVDVLNVSDRKFNFQNTAIGGTPRVPLFQSGVTLMGRVEMRF
jgi:Tfp pilus assembly protein PilF